MKSFKLALLTLTTALLLQGCGDDNDSSPSTSVPDQQDIDTNIIGFWSEDDANGNLSSISFMDDGTYVQVQVNNESLVDDPEGGLEWGEYSIDNKTGKLTTTQLFDKNGDMGLSSNLDYFARVSNGKLIIEADDNENGNIDSNEQFSFSEIEPDGIIGSWSFDDAEDDELIGVAFLDDSEYVHVQVDSDRSLDNPENGLEWGNYTVDNTTGLLQTSPIFDDNAGTGLSESRTRYARVTDGTALTIEVDDNQNGIIDSDESFSFSRSATSSVTEPQILSGLWEITSNSNDLVALAFLDDGTYLQAQALGNNPSTDPNNGMEWGKYTLKSNGELKIDDVIFDSNGTSGLSDDVLRTVLISDNTLTLGVDENENGIIESSESYVFSKAKSENQLGVWKNNETDDELLAFIFLDNGTFVHLEVDEEIPLDSSDPEPSGMLWYDYTLNSQTQLLTINELLYSNNSFGLSDVPNAYIKVSADTLKLEVYEDEGSELVLDGSYSFERQ